jgi:hypothetical protein
MAIRLIAEKQLIQDLQLIDDVSTLHERLAEYQRLQQLSESFPAQVSLDVILELCVCCERLKDYIVLEFLVSTQLMSLADFSHVAMTHSIRTLNTRLFQLGLSCLCDDTTADYESSIQFYASMCLSEDALPLLRVLLTSIAELLQFDDLATTQSGSRKPESSSIQLYHFAQFCEELGISQTNAVKLFDLPQIRRALELQLVLLPEDLTSCLERISTEEPSKVSLRMRM